MKKTFISLSVAALFGSGMAQAIGPVTVNTTGNNFTMVSASNGLTGGTNDVTFTWDGTYRTAVVTDKSYNATLSSPTAFSGNIWTAHHMNVFGPGTYTFDTSCTAATAACVPGGTAAQKYTLTVGAGQVGVHMLFNWSTSANIDVVLLWDMNKSWAGTGTVSAFNAGGANTVNTVWDGVSIDTPASTIAAGALVDETNDYSGTKMIDGPFIGQSANFNVMGISAAEPAVSSNNPTGASVGTGSVVEVVFNKAMDPLTLTTTSFTVIPTIAGGPSVCGGGSIAPSVGNTTFTCTPTALLPATNYTATITTAATSAAGYALLANKTWSFTTGAAAATLTLSATGTAGTTTVSIPGGGSLASVGLVDASQINATLPANVRFNEGLVNYKITGVAGGATVPVTITFPVSIVGKTLYKIDTIAVAPAYRAIPEVDFTRDPNGTTITMNVTDCTAAPCTGYDTNPASGTIEDPIGGGTVVVNAAAVTLGAAGGGGGCAVNPNGQFDASLILTLLASLGYLGWKRKRHH